MFNTKKQEEKLTNREIELYKQERKLRVDEEVLEYKNKVVEEAKKCADSMASKEHDWHSRESEKNTELAKLDAAIDHKKALLSELKDVRETEIKVLKDLHAVAIKDKDSLIELLKDQVKILTTKLTEIKISDVHLNANLQVAEKK